MAKKEKIQNAHPDELIAGGDAMAQMLGSIDVDTLISSLKKEILETKSESKKNALIKRLKYTAGLRKLGMKPNEAYMLHTMPVVPPIVRPTIQMGGNRIEYADSNLLIRDHMLVNNALKEVKDYLPNDQLIKERSDLYNGAKAVVGLGDAITGSGRGKQLRGFISQVSGQGGPKGGFFQSKLLSKKQDFSGRATIYAEPSIGYNEIAIPKDTVWTMYNFHLIRDLVKKGYNYVDAKKAVEERNPAATASFNKLIKEIPVIALRNPTLLRTNLSAHYPVPTDGKTLGLNPLQLPLYQGDFDGDAQSLFVPITPEAVAEAREKLTPSAHIFDYRKAQKFSSMIAPGHEAIVGSTYLTEPDTTQAPVRFNSEEEVLEALKKGEIKENTPIILNSSK